MRKKPKFKKLSLNTEQELSGPLQCQHINIVVEVKLQSWSHQENSKQRRTADDVKWDTDFLF